MPSELMDQRRASSLCLPPSPASSFFSEEIRFPPERQVGFWKPETTPAPDQSGTGERPLGPLLSGNRTSSPPMASWSPGNKNLGRRSDVHVQPASVFLEGSKSGLNGAHYENALFSSSLSDIFDRKLILSSNNVPRGQPLLFLNNVSLGQSVLSSTNVPLGHSVDALNSNVEEDETFKSLEEIEAQTIGDLLPDDDDLLSGVTDYFRHATQSNVRDDMDDDIFYTGGGIELEADDAFKSNITSDLTSGGVPNDQQGGLLANEHPLGEHPSRTLFVRNINSNVEDDELKALFEQYGDIRTLYTACKHRGFVMISYYDIRAARNAMRALQNKPLRLRKLDIHFSIPKDNPSDKDINQGTLVVFNLDSSVSNDDIHQIFGVYGEIKEIRETPHKRYHKFIEFYDARAAEAALRALNRSDIAGKKIKLEPSRPGGARRCSMQQLSPELELDECSEYRHGSPHNSSPTGFYVSPGSIPLGGATSNGHDNGSIQGPNPAVQASIIPFMETSFHGISSSMPRTLSSPSRVASVNNQSNSSGHGELSHSLGQMKYGFQPMQNFHPHSLPEYHDGMPQGIPYNSSNISPVGVNSRPPEGIDGRHIHKAGPVSFNPSFEHNENAFRVARNGSCPLHGHHIWNNASAYHHHPPGPMIWSNPPPFLNNIPPQMHGLPGAPSHMLNTVLPVPLHHVGSAPTVNPSFWDRRQGFPGDSTDAPTLLPGSLGNMGLSGNSPMHPMELASHSIFPRTGGNFMDPAHIGFSPPQQRCHMFHGRNPMVTAFDTPNDRIRSRRSDATVSQPDNKRQYELDIDRIIRGEDSRTTLMIKNIPNKYTSKMLLAAIDEHNRGTYNFIYLPIDFKNKCNVGYAFINMIDPRQIIPFYKAFNGKKWEKFNSEKVASLAYARIQGKAALIAHFQNSSLMNEDKRCRPILFHSDGPNAGDQEPFPMGVSTRSRPGRSRASGNDENHQESSASSPNREDTNVIASSSDSTKE